MGGAFRRALLITSASGSARCFRLLPASWLESGLLDISVEITPNLAPLLFRRDNRVINRLSNNVGGVNLFWAQFSLDAKERAISL